VFESSATAEILGALQWRSRHTGSLENAAQHSPGHACDVRLDGWARRHRKLWLRQQHALSMGRGINVCLWANVFRMGAPILLDDLPAASCYSLIALKARAFEQDRT
jgi:hypothetical protein